MSVLFYDGVCPSQYCSETLKLKPLGGTEATVVRVAEGLSQQGYDVRVMQHSRTEDSLPYCKPESGPDNPKSIVVLRNPHDLLVMKERYPRAKLYLWLHDLVGQPLVDAAQILVDTKATVICVSDFHVLQAKEALSRAGHLPGVLLKRIYNPIDDELAPSNTMYDKNKLVFFSSPHKGLSYTLKLFEYIHRLEPTMTLYIANPGYIPSPDLSMEGVVNLGPLPHKEALEHVRQSLCVFYPNTVFPETFGLVYAEANAVGTPVITHDMGAAPEVLFHPAEVMDVRQYGPTVDRVLSWRSGNRPTVKAKPEFRLKNVLSAWKRLIAA